MVKTLGTGINMTMDIIKNIGAVSASFMAVATLVGGVWWVVRRLVRISDAVQQLRPNGGSSLADKVNEIAKGQAQLTKTVGTLADEVEKLKVFDSEVAQALTDNKRGRRR